MKKIEEKDRDMFEYLIGLVMANDAAKIEMRNLCKKYQMRGCDVCLSCDQQVRSLFNKIKDYYNKNK